MEPILSRHAVFMSEIVRGFHTIPLPAPREENAGLPWYQGLVGWKEGAVRAEDRGVPDGFGSVLDQELALDSFRFTHFDSCHPLVPHCARTRLGWLRTGQKHLSSSASAASLPSVCFPCWVAAEPAVSRSPSRVRRSQR